MKILFFRDGNVKLHTQCMELTLCFYDSKLLFLFILSDLPLDSICLFSLFLYVWLSCISLSNLMSLSPKYISFTIYIYVTMFPQTMQLCLLLKISVNIIFTFLVLHANLLVHLIQQGYVYMIIRNI